MGLINHAPYKVGSKLWNPQHTSRRADLLLSHTQNVCSRKERHDTSVIHRNVIWINTRQVLKLPNHGRIIVSKNIKLEDIFIDIVEVEVGGLPLGGHIVSWILDRCKVINIHVVRDNNDSTRVLSSRPLDSGSSLRQTLNFGVPIELPVVALVALDKSIGSLSRNGTNGTSPKGILSTKNIPHVQVSARLILSGEVQINIGYLVPVKTKEGLKWNILTVLAQLVTTLWTVFIRHIKARTIGTICDELAVLAFATDIVGRQRINLGNPNHGRDKAGSDRPPRTYQIAPLVGALHQHLRSQVNYGKAIPQDRSQFFFNPQVYDIWQRIAINLKGFLIGQLGNRLLSLVNERCIEVALDYLDRLKGFRQLIRIGDNQLLS